METPAVTHCLPLLAISSYSWMFAMAGKAKNSLLSYILYCCSLPHHYLS